MQKTRLGRTGLLVTRSAFGALPIQRLAREDAALLLRRAYDSGINFFDTARVYSDSEAKIAYALGDVRRQIILATKTMAGTPDAFWSDLDISLKTLRTDYIDIYQLHNPSQAPGADDARYECLLKARQMGKIRHIGVTLHSISAAWKALHGELYDTIQFPLSALSTEEELDFARECGRRDIGVIAMKALSGGLLTSASLSMAVLRSLTHVVPIWGFQKESELDEVLSLELSPPELDDAMRTRIACERQGLSGEFCRGCGYCMPCHKDLRINWCARLPQALRRMPCEQFFTREWREEIAKLAQCDECGTCVTRCPYHLDVPALIKAAAKDYQSYGAENGLL